MITIVRKDNGTVEQFANLVEIEDAYGVTQDLQGWRIDFDVRGQAARIADVPHSWVSVSPHVEATVLAEEVTRIGEAISNLSGYMSDEALTNFAELKRATAALELALVRLNRADGESWETIGLALGISRQAAHERFSKL